MKKRSTIFLVLAFLVGLSLLLYPTVSNYWNSMHASQAVANYSDEVNDLNEKEYQELLQDARAYNKRLCQESVSATAGETDSQDDTETDSKAASYSLEGEQELEYQSLLDVTGTGIMGYIEIPNIDISLPIYHGTDADVLQIGVGHLEWTSLPVGGSGSHCVLSGHRGLPSAKLFTNLDKLVEGDTFVIRTLNEVLTYQVDQILIVEPEDVSALQIEKGKDLCTLVTCTPYGVNSHRLLVRGYRVENASEEIRLTADATQIDPILVAPALALPVLLVLLILLLVGKPRRKEKKEEEEKKAMSPRGNTRGKESREDRV